MDFKAKIVENLMMPFPVLDMTILSLNNREAKQFITHRKKGCSVLRLSFVYFTCYTATLKIYFHTLLFPETNPKFPQLLCLHLWVGGCV